jgi:putative transposase
MAEGWLYLATIIDLYSRKVVGWSMQPNMASKLVIDALSMAAVRRKPENEVLIHSDQDYSMEVMPGIKPVKLLGSSQL